jgi:hypothetical protein
MHAPVLRASGLVACQAACRALAAAAGSILRDLGLAEGLYVGDGASWHRAALKSSSAVNPAACGGVPGLLLRPDPARSAAAEEPGDAGRDDCWHLLLLGLTSELRVLLGLLFARVASLCCCDLPM